MNEHITQSGARFTDDGRFLRIYQASGELLAKFKPCDRQELIEFCRKIGDSDG